MKTLITFLKMLNNKHALGKVQQKCLVNLLLITVFLVKALTQTVSLLAFAMKATEAMIALLEMH